MMVHSIAEAHRITILLFRALDFPTILIMSMNTAHMLQHPAVVIRCGSRPCAIAPTKNSPNLRFHRDSCTSFMKLEGRTEERSLDISFLRGTGQRGITPESVAEALNGKSLNSKRWQGFKGWLTAYDCLSTTSTSGTQR